MRIRITSFLSAPLHASLLASLLALLIAALPALSGSSLQAAQLSPEDLLIQLDGLQTAYSRRYNSAESLGFASPETSDPSTPNRLLVTVLEFERPEQVTEAFDGVLNGLTARLILDENDVNLDRTDIDALGDRAELFAGHFDRGGYVALLAVQDGNLGILISTWGDSDEIQPTLMDVAEFVVDGEPGSAPVTPQFPASTTGGTFDVMPGHDDLDVLHGLRPMYDYDLLLDGGAHPIDEMEEHDHETPATPADDSHDHDHDHDHGD